MPEDPSDHPDSLNIKALLDLLKETFGDAHFDAVDLSEIPSDMQESFKIPQDARAKLFGEPQDFDRKTMAGLAATATAAITRQDNLFVGDLAKQVVVTAFQSDISDTFRNHLHRLGKKRGVDKALIDTVLSETIEDMQAQAFAGKLFYPEADRTALFGHMQMLENIGTFSLSADNTAFLLNQTGSTRIMASPKGNVLDPKSDLGKAVIIFDVFLEVLGSLLLLLNVTFPKFNWDKVLGKLQDALRNRAVRGFFNKLLNALTIFVRMLLNPNADKEQILKQGLTILKIALGTDQVWEWLEAGFDLGWLEWLKLGAQFILLTTLDGLTGGVAVAGKVALLLLTGWDIIKKLKKLE